MHFHQLLSPFRMSRKNSKRLAGEPSYNRKNGLCTSSKCYRNRCCPQTLAVRLVEHTGNEYCVGGSLRLKLHCIHKDLSSIIAYFDHWSVHRIGNGQERF